MLVLLSFLSIEHKTMLIIKVRVYYVAGPRFPKVHYLFSFFYHLAFLSLNLVVLRLELNQFTSTKTVKRMDIVETVSFRRPAFGNESQLASPSLPTTSNVLLLLP